MQDAEEVSPDWETNEGKQIKHDGLLGSNLDGTILRESESSQGSGGGMAEQFQQRTFKLAKDTVLLFRASTPVRYDPAFNVICKQVIRSATSTGANYRAVRRARSDKEFYAKLCIVVEECDETIYWLALALQTDLGLHKQKARNLLAEAKELCKVFSKSRATVRNRLKYS